MLQRTLGSGWGVVLPGIVISILALSDLSVTMWKGVIIVGLLLAALMLYHRQLRHFILLPACLALISAVMLITLKL